MSRRTSPCDLNNHVFCTVSGCDCGCHVEGQLELPFEEPRSVGRAS